MAKNSAPQPPTLFDASVFDISQLDAPQVQLERSINATTPAGPLPVGLGADRFAAFAAKGIVADADLARTRRRRALARLAKRRYLADNEGYEVLEQTRRALHLVRD